MAKKNNLQVFKKITIVIILLSSMVCCTAQNKNILKQNKMEKFDIQKFENKKDAKGEYVYNEGNYSVNIKRQGEYYLKEVKDKKKPNLIDYYAYDNNGNLRIKRNFFLGLNIGKDIIYNEQGEVIRIDDYTRPEFTFTVEQLAEKMKQDYNIDLYNEDPDNVFLRGRSYIEESGKEVAEWEVVYYGVVEKYRHQTFIIDGKDGHLISLEPTKIID